MIRADRGRKNGWTEGEFGVLPVSVDGRDVTGLVLQTSAGSTIKGRVTFDARDRGKEPSRGQVQLTPIPTDYDLAPMSPANANINEDWTFDIGGVNGPRRLQVPRVPDGWTVKEVRVNGIDATDRPIAFGRTDQSIRDVEVVLTDRVSELAVSVQGEHTAPVAVVVFSTDRGRWYAGSRFLRSARGVADGPTRIAGLPFGTYYVAAVPSLPDEGEDAWQDPEYLDRIARQSTTVTVRDGEKQTISVPIR